MSEELRAVAATAARIFASLWPPERAGRDREAWAADVWQALARAEFTLLGVPERDGGAGAGLPEAATVLVELGRSGAPVPLVETSLLAGWLLAEARLPVPPGPLTAAAAGIVADRVPGGHRLSGALARVPYGHLAERFVVLVDTPQPLVASLKSADLPWVRGRNLAGEPRDSVTLREMFVPDEDAGTVDREVSSDAFRARGALGRSLLMAGAMDTALESSITYARQRIQFGRPVIRFQAVRHHLAEMAAEAVATSVAAMSAATLTAGGSPDRLLAAAAKVQASRAAGVVARLAHQVHGAIGFTREHSLRHSTTRLWSWRDEFGTDRYWAKVLGDAVCDSPGLWTMVTGSSREQGHD